MNLWLPAEPIFVTALDFVSNLEIIKPPSYTHTQTQTQTMSEYYFISGLDKAIYTNTLYIFYCLVSSEQNDFKSSISLND